MGKTDQQAEGSGYKVGFAQTSKDDFSQVLPEPGAHPAPSDQVPSCPASFRAWPFPNHLDTWAL